jgi:TPR repeat protein
VDEPADMQADADAIVQAGIESEKRGDWIDADRHYRRADELGSAEGAYRLGVLFYNKGLIQSSSDALRRALDRGHPEAAAAMTAAFTDPQVSGSEEDVRRGDQAGRGVSSFELGVILNERGDLAGAEAAYRRAIDRGHVAAATNLGLLLFQQNDISGAKAALRSAEAGGDGLASEKLQLIAQMGY